MRSSSFTSTARALLALLIAALSVSFGADANMWPEKELSEMREDAQEPLPEMGALRVLYIGEPGTSREKEFAALLRKNVARVESASRGRFKPSDADGFDVVLLDWPQSGMSLENRKGDSPLGARDSWSKPTVLLGSAGLNLAVVWKIRGGSG